VQHSTGGDKNIRWLYVIGVSTRMSSLNSILSIINSMFIFANVILLWFSVRNASSPTPYVEYNIEEKPFPFNDVKEITILLTNGGPGTAKNIHYEIVRLTDKVECFEKLDGKRGKIPGLAPRGSRVLARYHCERGVPLRVSIYWKKYPLVPNWVPRFGGMTTSETFCFDGNGNLHSSCDEVTELSSIVNQ